MKDLAIPNTHVGVGRHIDSFYIMEQIALVAKNGGFSHPSYPGRHIKNLRDISRNVHGLYRWVNMTFYTTNEQGQIQSNMYITISFQL